MKEERYEIRFSGSGGQGIIMAAIIMAEAAGVWDKRYVCQTQSYGPEARGGSSIAEVVISNKVIDYPKTMKLDLLLAMNQTSCDANFLDLKPDGLLVVDSTRIGQIPTSRSVAIPFTRIARKEVGQELLANMVALGTVGHLCRMVSLKSLQMALLKKAPEGTAEMNLKALRTGIKAARKVDLNGLPRIVVSEDQEV